MGPVNLLVRVGRLSIATLNMQYGQGWDPQDPDGAPVDLALLIRELEQLAPDILFLQEVERVEPERGQVLPPPNFERLQQALAGYHTCFAYPPADARELPFGFGQAVFSRYPLHGRRAVPLPPPDLSFTFAGRTCQPTQRLLLHTEAEIAGQRVHLLNVHLQAFFVLGHSSDAFPQQRQVLRDYVRRLQGPCILAGDFNSAPGEATITELEALGLRSVQHHRVTWKREPYVLDHILHSPHFVLSGHAVHATPASDHDVVWATLELDGSRS